MQLHQIKPKASLKREKRVGRGDKTAGRGTKGQKARAGAKIRPAIRDLIKKLPKRRGRGKHSFRPFRSKPVVLDLSRVAEHFSLASRIDPAALLHKGLIGKIKGRIPKIKILGQDPIKKKLNFKGMTFSETARAAIEKAGGTIQ